MSAGIQKETQAISGCLRAASSSAATSAPAGNLARPDGLMTGDGTTNPCGVLRPVRRIGKR